MADVTATIQRKEHLEANYQNKISKKKIKIILQLFGRYLGHRFVIFEKHDMLVQSYNHIDISSIRL